MHPLSRVPESRLATSAGAEPAPDVVELDGGSSAAEDGLGAGRRAFSLGLLLHYKAMILAVFVGLSALSLTGIWTLVASEYQAKTLLEVRSLVPRLVTRTEETGLVPQYQQFLRSQVEIMQNPAVLQRVLELEAVKRTSWYGQPPSAVPKLLGLRPPLLERLQSALTVTPVSGTELIEVTAKTRVPGDAAVIANGVLDEYLRFVKERFSEEDRKLFDELNDEKDKLEREIGFAERIVADARKDLRTISPDELITQRRVRLDELEAEVEQLNLELAIAEHQLAGWDAPPEEGRPTEQSGAGPAAGYEDDSEWRQLLTRRNEAQDNATLARGRLGAAHPTMLELEKKVELAEKALQERQAQLEKLAELGWPHTATQPGQENLATNPRILRKQLSQLKFRKELLQRHADEVRQSFEREFNTAEALRKHNGDLERCKSRLQLVRNRLYELDEKGRVPASIRLIGRALPPTGSHRDRRVKFSLAAVFLSLGAGLASAYLRVVLSPQVYEASDVRRSVQGAFLGRLPLRRKQEALALENCPIQAEAIRMVRTALLVRLSGPDGAIVQITSAGTGSGKSTMAILLARSLAQCGKNVLLVDADLHQPSLAARFVLEPAPGLINLLADKNVESQSIRATATPKLSVLPAGKWSQREDLELLVDGAFQALLERWRARYDIILLDSPPLLATADAAIMSRHADGTVMVARERHCHRAALTEAFAVLSAAGGRLLGTVFVGSESTHPYGYGYRYGYGYGSGEQASPPAEK